MLLYTQLTAGFVTSSRQLLIATLIVIEFAFSQSREGERLLLGPLAGLFRPALYPRNGSFKGAAGRGGRNVEDNSHLTWCWELTPPLSPALEMEPRTLVHCRQVNNSASELYPSKGLKYLIIMFRA